MANEGLAGISRFGGDSGFGASPAPRDLFLKVFAGEVLTAFERYAVTNGRTRVRSISSGKSAQFPLIGAMSASYLTPGHNIIQEGGSSPTYLSQPASGEKVITIDGVLQSSTMIHDIDEAMSHFDVRGPYAREMGWALAKEYDIHTLQTIAFGAYRNATLTGDASDWGQAGVNIADTAFNTTISNTKSTIQNLARQFDEADVPETGRHLAVDPVTYHMLASDSTLASTDYNRNTGGDIGTSTIMMVNGFQIHKTNRLADLRALGDYSSGDLHAQQFGTDYVGNMTDIVGVAWQQDWSVGVVKLKSFSMQSEYKLEYLSTLMVGGFSCGHGVLHNSACGIVRDAAS